MSRPICKYPRQPTGPSGFGESGVRRLQDTGGAYQRSRPDSNTLSIQSGDFSRVIIDAVPEYLSTAIDGAVNVVRDTKSYRLKFTKSLASKNVPGTAAFGPNGLYVAITVEQVFSSFPDYDYEVRPGVSETVEFGSLRFNIDTIYGGFYLGKKAVTLYTFSYMYLPLIPGQSMFFKVGDEVSYWGKTPEFGRCCVSFSAARIGRVDFVGRQLSDIRLIHHREKNDGGVTSYVLNVNDFTRDDAEFMWLTKQVVLKNYTVVVFAETFFRPGPVDSGADYIPKFWIATTRNDDSFGGMTYSDMTAGVFSGARQPVVSTSPINHYITLAGRQYQFDLSATMFSMRVQAVADDAFVMSWQQRMPGGWRMRVARVLVADGLATATMSYESTEAATRGAVQLWQSIVHLGNGFVLAKIVSGSQGIGLDVSFRLSSDGGSSWGSSFNPVGFSAPLKNQYFGNFRVNKALSNDETGRVLMPAWDVDKLAYHVWASEDNGTTWEKQAKIYKPSTFLRVDTLLAGDGGGNFDDLVPGPIYSEKIDVTLPDRYKDRT